MTEANAKVIKRKSSKFFSDDDAEMISPIYDIPDHIDYGSEKTKNDNPHSLKIKDDDDEDNDIESANHLKKNGKSNKLEIEQIKKVYVSDNVPDKVKWEYVVRIINKKV